MSRILTGCRLGIDYQAPLSLSHLPLLPAGDYVLYIIKGCIDVVEMVEASLGAVLFIPT